MAQTDALQVGVSLVGLQAVLRGLAQLTDSVKTTGKNVDNLGKAAAAFAAGAAVMSYAALKAYDSFSRFQMGAESLLGVIAGDKFAKALQAFSVPSAFSADILRKAGQGLLASGLGPNQSMGVITATTNLAAAGGSSNEELQRTFLALRQIQSKGVVRGQEANQQLAESLPLLARAIQDITGRSSIIGMPASEFFSALERAGNSGKYAGAQDKLAEASPMIALQNFKESVMNSLIPTGKLLAKGLKYLLIPLNKVVEMFSVLNEKTGGLAGLAVILGLLKIGVGFVSKFIQIIIGVTKAEWEQLSVLGKVNAALIAFHYRLQGTLLNHGGPGGKVGSAYNSVSGKKGLSDAVLNFLESRGVDTTKLSGMLGKMPIKNKNVGAINLTSSLDMLPIKTWEGFMEMIGNVFGKIKPLMNLGKLAKVGIWTTIIMLAIDVIPKLLGNLVKIFSALGAVLAKAWGAFMKTPVGKFLELIGDFLSWVWDGLVSILSLDWLVKLLGIEDQVDESNANAIGDAINGSSITAPNRPLRKSDAETWMYSRVSEMY